MNRADDDATLAAHLAQGDPLLHEELAALRREVRSLRDAGPSSRRGRRRSMFDPHPAVSASTIRRRTGLVLTAILALMVLFASVAGFALLRAIAAMIGDWFAPQLVTASVVRAAVALLS